MANDLEADGNRMAVRVGQVLTNDLEQYLRDEAAKAGRDDIAVAVDTSGPGGGHLSSSLQEIVIGIGALLTAKPVIETALEFVWDKIVAFLSERKEEVPAQAPVQIVINGNVHIYRAGDFPAKLPADVAAALQPPRKPDRD